MRLVQRGDAPAFEAIYDRHGSAAFSLAYRIAGNRTQAEDIVQEAFLSVWRSSVRYQPERGNLRSWLLSVVHPLVTDHAGVEEAVLLYVGRYTEFKRIPLLLRAYARA